jgi:hypothetical protein
MTLSEVMIWSAVLALPAILSSTSLGYFLTRWFQQRRAKQQST